MARQGHCGHKRQSPESRVLFSVARFDRQIQQPVARNMLGRHFRVGSVKGVMVFVVIGDLGWGYDYGYNVIQHGLQAMGYGYR